ncbi:MAG: nucleotidyltransferase domain-containing protein [Nanoarchaeota archaeon]|nr:nucleotidyltransferase domain-containing protein [Nanoarchaeota archaeon]MBU1946795.1 nucleotidyltransferase domain-containing protein [Nanoarchaeota archaeon]
MLKNLLKTQKLISLIKEFKTKEIFDIVVYGSLVRGKDKPSDIDIAIVLNEEISVNEKLELAERVKNKLDLLGGNFDVKAIGLSDLYDEGFIARQAILAEGYSLIYEKFLHEKFGFKTSVIFKYKLDKLDYSHKKMFYYALNGRRKQKGLLELKGAKMMGDCVVKVPLIHSEEFKDMFKLNGIDYKIENSVEY